LDTTTDTVITLSVAPPGGRSWGGGKFLIIRYFILDAEVADRILECWLKLNGLGKTAVEEAKLIEQNGLKLLFDLSLQLHKSVTELEQLPLKELTEWIAYYTLENKKQEAEKQKEISAQWEAGRLNAKSHLFVDNFR
jgi:hypothetical protein